MPEYLLHDFITTVPSCVQTTCLAAVLEIFEFGQCDRLVVVSEQQCPVGLLYAAHLMPQLIRTYGCSVGLDTQQLLWTLDTSLVEPIAILPAELSVEHFGLYLRSQQSRSNIGFDWVLVDSTGKYLGLLDTTKVWQFLASFSVAMDTNERERAGSSPSHEYRFERRAVRSLVQLLELLPWPLMLQTGTGEVVTQNPAWCQQFKTLSESEAVGREVEEILKTSFSQDIKHYLHNVFEYPKTHLPNLPVDEAEVGVKPLSTTNALTTIDNTATSTSPHEDHVSSSRCQSGSQPGTCICVCPIENGQERVWQFIKIPLQEYGLKFIDHALDASAVSTDLWLLAATDVTEQQLLASELAAKNADLIQLNRLKDEFLACISHELKTPITAVMGLSTLLKDQSLGELNERQVRYARLIHQSGRHLMTVVNDILDLTRMETGQLKLTLEPVKIASVCDRAIEQARTIEPKTSQRSQAGESAEQPFKHRFNLVIEPELDSFVADELRLRQMLVHLLSNAFKFTEADGEVGLRVSRWEGWIAFTVWDTGIGIPEQKQHLIFQKFQQLESPLTRQFEGTGLGLVLTRSLARLHGGDVSFLSKQGKGSEFTLLLPPSPPHKIGGAEEVEGVEEVENWEGGETSPHHHTSSKRLMLVVEAAPRFIEDLTEQLTDLGYRVVIARSGTEALEKARRLQPGALLLNPLLPLLSGWDVLTLLKSDAATRQIPVIVTATRAEKDQAFSNRADEFLSLPVQQQTLQQVLARFCPQPSVSQSGKAVSQSIDTNTPLTILHLSPSGLVTPSSWLLNSGLLHQHHYRILEADDLEQAELLARIWQPDLVLLNGTIPDPLAYLQQLSQHPHLAVLPLVTLDAATTQVASQVTGLSVFPCLTPTEKLKPDTLLPVLQIAAGKLDRNK